MGEKHHGTSNPENRNRWEMQTGRNLWMMRSSGENHKKITSNGNPVVRVAFRNGKPTKGRKEIWNLSKNLYKWHIRFESQLLNHVQRRKYIRTNSGAPHSHLCKSCPGWTSLPQKRWHVDSRASNRGPKLDSKRTLEIWFTNLNREKVVSEKYGGFFCWSECKTLFIHLSVILPCQNHPLIWGTHSKSKKHPYTNG